MAFFIDDPPLSLQYKSPATQARRVADRLQALASEVRKSVAEIEGLEPYAAQFAGEEGRTGVA